MAGPAVIDFESVPANTSGSGARQPPITTQYADLGVSLNSPLPFRYTEGGGFPHSGAQAIEHCYGVEFCTNPFEVTFRTPMARVRVWVGASSSFSNPVPMIMEALAADGSSRGTSRITIPAARGAPPMQSMEVRSGAADIARVVVRPENDALMNGVALDDLEFEGLPPLPDLAVPRVTAEPGENQTVRVTVEITNAGPGTSAPSDAVVRVDAWASPAQTVQALAPGETVSLAFLTPAQTPGEHVLLAAVDPAGSLAEVTDSNNEARQTFVISQPRPPQASLVPVPSLTGMPRGEAEQTLAGSGLALGPVERRPRFGFRTLVVDQSPAVGEAVPSGTSVKVWMSDPLATWVALILLLLGGGVALARRLQRSQTPAQTPQPTWQLRPDPGTVTLLEPPDITVPGLQLRLVLDRGRQEIESDPRSSP